MIIYPAIDLKNGECVRLMQGRMRESTVYGRDPAAMARRWEGEGAQWLHVVDLDGAFAGVPRNLEAIRAIIGAVSIPVEVGGGIRTMAAVAELIEETGAARVILGTAALRDQALIQRVVKRYTDRIAVGVDARDGRASVAGWVEDTGTNALELALRMRDLGVRTLIYTDIGRDGTLTGPNIEATRRVIEETGVDVILSGGVTSIYNVTQARQIGAAGCVIGRALYEGAIRLAEAIQEAQSC
jgi:phosphoribosylformimino-5-aminoimidazole carboxamide ribotide isomerase